LERGPFVATLGIYFNTPELMANLRRYFYTKLNLKNVVFHYIFLEELCAADTIFVIIPISMLALQLILLLFCEAEAVYPKILPTHIKIQPSLTFFFGLAV